MALGDIHLRFAWLAWHFLDWAGSGDALGAPWSRVTPRHFCVAGSAVGDVHLRFSWQALRLLAHTKLCHTPSFTHILVTHHLAYKRCHTPSSLSHTIFHTHLCHTPSFTHNLVTHHLCHTPSSTRAHTHTTFPHSTLSHAIFHTQL